MKLALLLLLLTWDYCVPGTSDPIALPQWGIVFEVWHTTDLAQPLTLWTNVDQPPVIVGGQVQECFAVRAKDTITGEVSDWGQ